MQLSGSMTRKFGPSWKQSTGHTSTQSVCLQLMQFSVTTWVTVRRAVGDTHSLAAPIAPGPDLDQGVSVAPARSSGLALYARCLCTGASPASIGRATGWGRGCQVVWISEVVEI